MTKLDEPIKVLEIKVVPTREFNLCGVKVGDLVSVRPCGDENPDNKTMLGIYLASLAIEHVPRYDKETKTLTMHALGNPAMFVPELKRIVWGMESWWGPLAPDEQVKAITDEVIADQPYVKALKILVGGSKPEENGDEGAET